MSYICYSILLCSLGSGGLLSTPCPLSINKIISLKILFFSQAKKTKKQCFVSYNVPTENMLLSLVEQRINQEIKDRPHNF